MRIEAQMHFQSEKRSVVLLWVGAAAAVSNASESPSGGTGTAADHNSHHSWKGSLFIILRQNSKLFSRTLPPLSCPPVRVVRAASRSPLFVS